MYTKKNAGVPRVPKKLDELAYALKDNLQILKDSLRRVSLNRPEEARLIANQLRLLVCDESNKTKGILTFLLKKFDSLRSMELEKLRSSNPYKVVRDSKTTSLSVCEIIKSISEQDGGAHVDLARGREYYEFLIGLEMGKSSKTDPFLGFLNIWGNKVLQMGEGFLIEQFGIWLR